MSAHDRHGLLRALRSILRSPVPPEYRSELFSGWLLFFVFLLQVLTGILLSLYFQPSPPLVAESVQFIMRDVDSGWLVRGVHHWSSYALIVLAVLHVARLFVVRGYRGAASPNWYAAVCLVLLATVLTYTGELLTWDQESFWRLSHALDRIGSFGSAGAGLAQAIRGGDEVAATTLSRTYSAHSLFLPWLVWLLLVANLWFLARRMKISREARA